jgi:hypothetical protein
MGERMEVMSREQHYTSTTKQKNMNPGDLIGI